jgi:hypothetical protein
MKSMDNCEVLQSRETMKMNQKETDAQKYENSLGQVQVNWQVTMNN